VKTSISTYSLIRLIRSGQMSLPDVVNWIADLGADAVEFGGLERTCPIDKSSADKLRRQCEKRKLAISSYTFAANFLQLDPAAFRAEIDRIKEHIDITARLGAKLVRHDATYGFPKDYTGKSTFEYALKWLVPAIQEVADHAAQYKITTTSENHGFFVQHSRRVEKLIKAVARANYGATVDMGNFTVVDENPVTAVRRLASYARFAHAKDMHLKPATEDPGEGWYKSSGGRFWRGAILGHGSVDVRGCLAELARAGYKGHVSLEFEGMEDPLIGARIGFENLVRYLKGLKASK
jgi:sugar phosphate isomerase/epimerase